MEKILSKKALGIAVYAIVILEITKNIKFLQINSFILFIIYGIIGLILPILLFNRKPKKKKSNKEISKQEAFFQKLMKRKYANQKKEKLFQKFVFKFGFSMCIFINTSIYYIYQTNYYIFENKSFFNRFTNSVGVTLPVYCIFIITLWVFCDKLLYRILVRENNKIIAVLIVSVIYAILLDNQFVVISIIYGIIAFSLSSMTSNSKASLYILSLKEISTIFYLFLYKYYEAYELMHYFVFIITCIAFFVLLSSFENLKYINIYREEKLFEKIEKDELKILWILVILIGYIFVVNI